MPASRKSDAPLGLVEHLNAQVQSKPVNDFMTLGRYYTSVELMLLQVRAISPGNCKRHAWNEGMHD